MKNPVLSNNAFVKGEESKMKAKMGDRPVVPEAMRHFDAYMSNNEVSVKMAENKLCKGLEDAFPRNKSTSDLAKVIPDLRRR